MSSVFSFYLTDGVHNAIRQVNTNTHYYFLIVAYSAAQSSMMLITVSDRTGVKSIFERRVLKSIVNCSLTAVNLIGYERRCWWRVDCKRV